MLNSSGLKSSLGCTSTRLSRISPPVSASCDTSKLADGTLDHLFWFSGKNIFHCTVKYQQKTNPWQSLWDIGLLQCYDSILVSQQALMLVTAKIMILIGNSFFPVGIVDYRFDLGLGLTGTCVLFLWCGSLFFRFSNIYIFFFLVYVCCKKIIKCKKVYIHYMWQKEKALNDMA